MLILIAQTFHISLDNLILGGNKEMNEMKNAMEQNLMVRKLVKKSYDMVVKCLNRKERERLL